MGINGELQGFFGSTRGIRQGGPLSPYLYVLVMDVLSMIIAKKVNESENFSFHWRCDRTRTTHLCFADDLLLFCGGSVQAVSTLKEAHMDFFLLSGMSANHAKSTLFIAGDNENLRGEISSLFGLALARCQFDTLGFHSSPLDSQLLIARC